MDMRQTLRQTWLWLLGGMMLANLAGCGQTITGRVVHGQTKESVFWATVTAYQQRPGSAPEKVTSVHSKWNGKFKIRANFNPDDIIRLVIFKELDDDTYLQQNIHVSFDQKDEANLGDIMVREVKKPSSGSGGLPY